MPISARLRDIVWLPKRLYAMFEDPLGLAVPGVGLLCFLSGIAHLTQVNLYQLSLMLFPVVMAIFASALHRYPFCERFLLFTVPLLAIVVGAGMCRIANCLMADRKLSVIVILALMLGPSMLEALRQVRKPREHHELRSVLAHVKERFKPGDVIYCHYRAEFGMEYYAERFGFRTGDYTIGAASQQWWHRLKQPWSDPNVLEDMLSIKRDIDRLRGRERVWFVFSHYNVHLID